MSSERHPLTTIHKTVMLPIFHSPVCVCVCVCVCVYLLIPFYHKAHDSRIWVCLVHYWRRDWKQKSMNARINEFFKVKQLFYLLKVQLKLISS